MMGTKQQLKDGDEVDQVSAPNMYKYLKRRSSKIKRKMRRRARREGNLTLRKIIEKRCNTP